MRGRRGAGRFECGGADGKPLRSHAASSAPPGGGDAAVQRGRAHLDLLHDLELRAALRVVEVVRLGLAQLVEDANLLLARAPVLERVPVRLEVLVHDQL